MYAEKLPFRMIGKPLCGQLLAPHRAGRQTGPSVFGARRHGLAVIWPACQAKDQRQCDQHHLLGVIQSLPGSNTHRIETGLTLSRNRLNFP